MRRDLKILSPHYVDFIRSRGCCVCRKGLADCDHLQARGTGNGKQNDLTGIPLCREHHTERGQIGNIRFEAKYNINLWREAAMYLIEFFIHEDRRKEATIYVSDKKSPGNS